MNIIFGSVATAQAAVPGAAAPPPADGIRGFTPQTVHRGDGDFPFALSLMTDRGTVLGQASRDSVHPACMGAFLSDLPGWPDAARAPLEDPDATARFLLERYDDCGESFLDGLNGHYALAVVDTRSRRVLLACDPFGGRAWYVHEADGRLTFSTHLATLARGLGPALRIDRAYEDFFLIHGFYPDGRTPYAGVRALPAGTRRICGGGADSSAVIAPFDPWQGTLSADFADPPAESEVIERLYEAVVRATREQLPVAPRTVGVLLGGFDSALVAALIQRLGHTVETFSFRYRDGAYNQPHTDTLADFLGIRHNWIDVDRGDIEAGIRAFPETFSQPTNWPNYTIQTAQVCAEMRRRGVDLCYSGDGCDAVFMGYPGTYRRARVFGALPTLPGWLMRAIVALAAWPGLDRLLGHPYRVALNILRSLGRGMPARAYLSFRILDEVSLRQLRADTPPQPARPLDEMIEDLSRPHAALSVLRLAFLGKALVSPNRNKLLDSADRTGVTILAPYLHPGLKRFALDLPDTLLRPEQETRSRITGKYILMKMAEVKGLLPPAVIYQPKVAAVDAPIDAWYDGPMRGFLLQTMQGLPFRHDEAYVNRLIGRKRAEDLFKRYAMSDRVISHAVSLLATYAAFCAIADESDEATSGATSGT